MLFKNGGRRNDAVTHKFIDIFLLVIVAIQYKITKGIQKARGKYRDYKRAVKVKSAKIRKNCIILGRTL